MTDLLERAIEAARALPPVMQDDVARMVMAFAGGPAQDDLTPEDEAAIARSREAMRRGDYASSEDMAAIRAKHGD